MPKLRALVSVATLSAAVFASAVPAPAADAPQFASLDAAVDKLLNVPHGAPAISIAIVERGEIVHTYASGLAIAATNQAATPETRFEAGSITKMFTAVSVMQLVEAGAVNLDAPVAVYLPDAPHAHEITVRHLLSHTSGLADLADAAFSAGATSAPTTPAQMLAPLVEKPLDFAPGTKFEYSNSNYVVLGLLVEKLRGKPLAEVEQELIFAPAGMTQSSFGRVAPGVPYAVGYSEGTAPAQTYDPSWLFGAGDLVSTPSDIARFDIALESGKLISPGQFAKMLEGGHATGTAAGSLYALGITVTPFGSRTLAGHHGGIPGFAAENEMTTDPGYAVIVMGNSTLFYTSLVNAPAFAVLDPTDLGVVASQTATNHAREVAGLDPAIERGLRAFLAGIANNTLDRTTLAKQMSDALTPAVVAQIGGSLPPVASLVSLTLVAHDSIGKNDAYTFRADYGSKQVDYRFVLDADGKIAGFFLA